MYNIYYILYCNCTDGLILALCEHCVHSTAHLAIACPGSYVKESSIANIYSIFVHKKYELTDLICTVFVICMHAAHNRSEIDRLCQTMCSPFCSVCVQVI